MYFPSFKTLLVTLIISLSSFSSFALSTWVSYGDSNKESPGITLICLVDKTEITIKTIQTLETAPINNFERIYKAVNHYVFSSQNDSIKFLQFQPNSHLNIQHHKYGLVKLMPFENYNLKSRTIEIENLLLNNILQFDYQEKSFLFDINKYAISVDSSFSIYGQLFYIEYFKNEIFLVLTNMYGPILHIKNFEKNAIHTVLYHESKPIEIIFNLKEENNSVYEEQLNGVWISPNDELTKSVIDCKVENDSIYFSQNRCFFKNLCFKSEGIWAVCHNGKFIAYRDWDDKYKEHRSPQKLSFKLLDKNTLQIDMPYERGRLQGTELKTFNKIKSE